MFYLEFFDLGLDDLELLLTLEHMILRDEKDESDDERDDDYSPAERVSREECQKCHEEIINRIIYYTREETSECSRKTLRECSESLSEWSLDGKNIFSWSIRDDLRERPE